MNLKEGLDLLDDELSEEMNKVNWWKISESEAKSLGISMGILKEAQQDDKRAQDSLTRSKYLLLVVFLLCVASLVVHLSSQALVIALVIVILCNVVIERSSKYMAESMVKTQREALIDELRLLSDRHPYRAGIKVSEIVNGQKKEL